VADPRAPQKPGHATAPKSAPSARAPRRKRIGANSRFRYVPLLGLAVFSVALTLIYLRYIYPRGVRGASGGVPVALVLRGDETPVELAERLAALGLVEDPRRFAWYVRLFGTHAAAGPHLLARGVAISDLLAQLERRGQETKIVIPEGFTSFDIGRRLEAEGVCSQRAFADVVFDAKLLAEQAVHADSFEGYLFPATYEFARDSDPRIVLLKMKDTFDRRMATVVEQHAAGRLDLEQSLGWNLHEMVTLASMVEREAVQHDERPIIASVFLNRLRMPEFARKLLQCDPTAGYGCVRARERNEPLPPGCAGFTGRITPQVNADAQNRFSTYTHTGLPPGPIASPGAKSLAAVLDPATTRYLYFVARGGGRHSFSETYEAHQRAIHPVHSAPSADPLPDTP
jgi:UPF0755 protein